jgi:perosamine synthetase
VIEDASHAHGASYDGKPVGSLGQVGCFSLQGSKAMTGVEGGVATTNDAETYDRTLMLGHYGRIQKKLATDRYRDVHDVGLGLVYRANPLGIAMARAQLRRLPDLNAKHVPWFARLSDLPANLPGFRPEKVYPKATRGGLLLYTARFDPDVSGVPTQEILEALVAGGVDCQPGITPFGYGRMHREPVLSDFPFEGFGGPCGTPGETDKRSFPRAHCRRASASTPMPSG